MDSRFTIAPGQKTKLADIDPDDTGDLRKKKDAEDELAENVAALADLGYRLYAENRRALLLVLQGMDTSGKDGTIRHAMRGFNPQSCMVKPFKQPSVEELDHDFLWRIAKALPPRGHVGIFNRSHYEDVLVVRVHNLVPPEVWKTRYERINSFEKLVSEGKTRIVKVFLHISKDEQRKRLQARLDDPRKRWKFSSADLKERGYWEDYQQAYQDAIDKCSTDYAPWHIVPANRKWYRNLVVSRLLRKTLEEMDPQFPPAEEGLENVVVE
ncbi:MAG: polyphosphate kinase 2 family protein [Planctomycetota bacterium]